MNVDHLRRRGEQARQRRELEEKKKSQLTGFDALAGMDEMKKALRNEVIRPIVERERFEKFGIPLLNGLLLYGPPGCGKTFIAERLVEEIGFSFLSVKPSDLGSMYVHGGQEKIAALFQNANHVKPCMIFIDEIDAIIPSRDSDIHHHYAAEVNEILAQLNNCGERGIFVMGATNCPEKIDSAALRSGRFDKIVYVPPPDIAAREAMFKLLLKKRPSARSIRCRRLAELTGSYVASDIQKIVIEASRKAELCDSEITLAQLEQAIKETPPSVTARELGRYAEIKRRWDEDRSRTETEPKRSIGFITGSVW